MDVNMDGVVLPLTEETMALLKEKHPEPTSLSEDAVIVISQEEVYPDALEGMR